MPSTHAQLSPSAAERWMECPGSIKLGKLFPDKSSEYADEGTCAHALGELFLKRDLKLCTTYQYNRAFEEVKAIKYYCEEMHDYCDDYKAFVIEELNASGHEAQILLETKVDLTDWIPEGYGTIDIRIAANRVLKIIDLKYGKGIMVDSENNKQLMAYGLGALKEYDLLFDIEFVEIIIYQPRLENISRFMISAKALREWGEKVLIPAAKKAFDGAVDFKAGKWCQFCKAKPNCKTFAEYNLEIAKEQFSVGTDEEELELLKLAETNLLTDEQVSVIVLRAQEFIKWIDAVKDMALAEAIHNQKKWPGMKLVEGRSIRKISDELEARRLLVKKGFKKDEITQTKLLGITKLEKIIGAKDFNAVLTNLIFKPPGAPALVAASDKRPALNSVDKAIQEFGEYKVELDE